MPKKTCEKRRLGGRMHHSHLMFTNKRHSERGMISSALGLIASASIILAVVLSYQEQGAKNARYGLAVLFAFLFSIGGIANGVRAKMEKDVFLLFPVLGLVTNIFVILATCLIIYAGVYGL